jgi:hypothetical protein
MTQRKDEHYKLRGKKIRKTIKYLRGKWRTDKSQEEIVEKEENRKLVRHSKSTIYDRYNKREITK